MKLRTAQNMELTVSSSLPEPIVAGECDDPMPIEEASRRSPPQLTVPSTFVSTLPVCTEAVRRKLRVNDKAIGPLLCEVVSYDTGTKLGKLRRFDTNTELEVDGYAIHGPRDSWLKVGEKVAAWARGDIPNQTANRVASILYDEIRCSKPPPATVRAKTAGDINTGSGGGSSAPSSGTRSTVDPVTKWADSNPSARRNLMMSSCVVATSESSASDDTASNPGKRNYLKDSVNFKRPLDTSAERLLNMNQESTSQHQERNGGGGARRNGQRHGNRGRRNSNGNGNGRRSMVRRQNSSPESPTSDRALVSSSSPPTLHAVTQHDLEQMHAQHLQQQYPQQFHQDFLQQQLCSADTLQCTPNILQQQHQQLACDLTWPPPVPMPAAGLLGVPGACQLPYSNALAHGTQPPMLAEGYQFRVLPSGQLDTSYHHLQPQQPPMQFLQADIDQPLLIQVPTTTGIPMQMPFCQGNFPTVGYPAVNPIPVVPQSQPQPLMDHGWSFAPMQQQHQQQQQQLLPPQGTAMFLSNGGPLLVAPPPPPPPGFVGYAAALPPQPLAIR